MFTCQYMPDAWSASELNRAPVLPLMAFCGASPAEELVLDVAVQPDSLSTVSVCGVLVFGVLVFGVTLVELTVWCDAVAADARDGAASTRPPIVITVARIRPLRRPVPGTRRLITRTTCWSVRRSAPWLPLLAVNTKL